MFTRGDFAVAVAVMRVTFLLNPNPAMKTLIAFVVLAFALPVMGEPTFRCMDALCANFQQEVGPDHQHSHRCTDAACVNFQQFVPPNHRHLHRNTNVTSPNFQQYVPDRRPRRQ